MGFQASKCAKNEIFVSSYTSEMGHTWGEGKGFCVFSRNGSELKLEKEVQISQGTPSFMEWTDKYLYIALELEKGLVLCVDRETFEVVSTSEVIGFAPCHTKLHHSNKILFVANYVSGELVALGLNDNGTFTGKWSSTKSSSKASGEKGMASRQEGPHGHCVLPLEKSNYVLLADLGTDEVLCFSVDEETLELTQTSVATFPPGSGPRTLARNGKFIYCSCEISVNVAILTYEGDGIIKYVTSVKALSEDFSIPSSIAHLTVSPCGKFVIAGIRSHIPADAAKPSKELITKVSEKTEQGGMLSVLKVVDKGLELDSMHDSHGLTPRMFEFHDDILYVCNQDSNKLTQLKFDNGKFEFVAENEVGSPNCVLIS